VSIVGLPSGCTVEGANPLTVQASADLTTVVFDLKCPAAGTLAFVSTREGAPHIYVASADGTGIRRLSTQLPAEFAPAWSPDGHRLAFNSFDGTYVINRDGSGLRRLQRSGRAPSWSPDGKRLLVTGTINFTIIPVDEPDSPAVDLHIDDRAIATYGITSITEGTWSPDGARIAFSAWTALDMESLFVMNANGSNAATIVHSNAIWDECGPEWSPTGQTIAVLSMVLRAAAIVHADGGQLQPVFNPGTSCWDNHEAGEQSESGLAWSPDAKALAVTTRTPAWQPGLPWPQNQRASIAIVDVSSGTQLTLFPDAYDPTWTK
jgi:Tol biopolymer transport system component